MSLLLLLVGAPAAPGAPTPASATLAAPTAQRADVTVWLQALDGTWEVCGSARAIGVVPESVELTADAYGSKTASFDLKRPVFALWPDIAAFAPCMVFVGGQLVWRGRTGETPIRDGVDPVINVQCQGSQARLDDDVYQPLYVHSSLSGWRDARSSLSATLTQLVSLPQVQAGDGLIAITYPSGQASSGRGAAMLDLGPNRKAKRVVIDWSMTAGAANRAAYLMYSDTSADGGSSPSSSFVFETIHSGTGASSGTFVRTLSIPSRYLFIAHDANAHTPAADETLKITRALVFGETAYESAGASSVKASAVVDDALDKATMLLATDRSGIQTSSFNIDDLAPDEERTPREMIDGVNAFHNWTFKLDAHDRPIFKQRPSYPLLEIGAWSGASLTDAAANNGDEIYNRCIVRGEGPDGTPVVVQRSAGQQPGATLVAARGPSLGNPSFDANTTGWTSSAFITRDTAIFLSAPAAGRWDGDGARGSLPPGPTLSTTFTGVFKAGITYVLRFMTRGGAGSGPEAQLGFGDLANGDYAFAGSVPFGDTRAWTAHDIAWTPSKDRTGVTLQMNSIGFGGDYGYIDSVSLLQAITTIVDRRGFRRTFVLKPGFRINDDSGQQLADVHLQAHRTTPYRGSCRITPRGARYVLGGAAPHPSALLTMTQEQLRLAHRIDPDTGGQGRVATIADVKYKHRDESAEVELDDPRRNFDALLARMAVVQGVGR